MKTKIVALKNHVVRNRGRYGFVAGFSTAAYIHVVYAQQLNEFIEEQGLTEVFAEVA